MFGFVGVPQSGVGFEHSPLVRHATQIPAALHFGVGLAHWLSKVHFETHLSPTQNGAANPHWAMEVHSTHLSNAMSQTGVAPEQAVASVALHWRHEPATHAGAVALVHCDGVPEPRLPSHGEHTLFVQIGVAAPHCEESVQLTHVLVAVLQTDVGSLQAVAFEALHCTHAPAFPPDVRHTGVTALHSNGVVGGPKSPSQPTHVFVAALHEPVAPVHAPVCVASHWTHPPSLQTGKPALGHAVAPPEPKFPEHGPQPPAAVQMGRPGGQLVTPGTHV